jgi:opacity protein-like surface antigen
MWSAQLGLVIVLSLSGGLPQAGAEWYVAGYGGLSAPEPLRNVTMDQLGLRTDTQLFSGALTPPFLGTVTQSLKTADLSLKQSPIFGGKAGYFFKDEGMSWLGVELEAFTSQPTIKAQTVNTTHDITYLPTSPNFNPPPPAPLPNCTLGADCQIQTRIPGTLQLAESSMRLMTLAFNVVARYPGTVFQPYVGVGVGAFYFSSSGQISGRQVVPGINLQGGTKVLITEEWGFFVEYKYNRATITNFDPVYGLSGEYSAHNFVGGLAYHF